MSFSFDDSNMTAFVNSINQMSKKEVPKALKMTTDAIAKDFLIRVKRKVQENGGELKHRFAYRTCGDYISTVTYKYLKSGGPIKESKSAKPIDKKKVKVYKIKKQTKVSAVSKSASKKKAKEIDWEQVFLKFALKTNAKVPKIADQMIVKFMKKGFID